MEELGYSVQQQKALHSTEILHLKGSYAPSLTVLAALLCQYMLCNKAPLTYTRAKPDDRDLVGKICRKRHQHKRHGTLCQQGMPQVSALACDNVL